MERRPYVIVTLQGARYAFDVRAVRNMLWLPEVTPIAEAPRNIIGVVNIRGKVVPVMDLDIRFGRTRHRYALTDSLILLGHVNAETEEPQLGVIVNEILDVSEIAPDDIESSLVYGTLSANGSRLVTGVAKLHGEIVAVLSLETLMGHSRDVSGNGQTDFPTSSPEIFCPEAGPQERVLFHERAVNIMQEIASQERTGLVPVAVVSLNGEQFGVGLEAVREFSEIRQVIPVPCCPDHIVGTINLRGEIVTLVDIRGVLNMPPADRRTIGKVVVAQKDDLRVGVMVDDVHDVVQLSPAEMAAVPAAMRLVGDEYLEGTAHYGERMIALVDLQAILTKGGLTVNEEV